MITRIVKMYLSPDFVEDFKLLFRNTQPKILASDGCISVRLLQEENNHQVFFTVSEWESIDKLNAYRNADLFLQTWAIVKPNFVSKAEAWSLTDPKL